MVAYIIEENRKIFDLLKNMLKNGERYMFFQKDAKFSDDIEKYIYCNEVLIFKSIYPDELMECDHIASDENVDLVVFGDFEKTLEEYNFGNVKTFLLNTENMERFKNIDFGSSQIITCGMREKDTVIFSSIDLDEGSIMLDLQRSIINIKGEVVEAFEKKILIDNGGSDLGNETGKGAEGECELIESTLFALAILLYSGRLAKTFCNKSI